jgi:hypothetical protein
MRLIQVLTESKGQGTVVLVSVAIIASFLAGAVAFNQVRLIPDAFELRTNDLDPMTRAEVRGKNTASNFVPQAAWYQLNNITYNIGQEYGAGIPEDSYDGSCCGSGKDQPVKNLPDKYYDEVAERLQNQFEGYAGDELQYRDGCRVEIDPNVNVEYSPEQPNPILSSSGGDGLVTVYCRGNGLGITYKSDRSEYEIAMNNNRFPQLVSVMAAGAYKSNGGTNGVEELADHIESDEGKRDGSLVGGHTGYWSSSDDGDSGLTANSYCKDTKSDAKDSAESDVQSTIDSRIDNIIDRFPGQAQDAMSDAQGGSKICFFGACTPELPGDINWKDIGTSASVTDHSVEQDIDSSATEVCCDYDYSDNECDGYGWDGSASGKYYLDDVTVRVKAEENRDSDWNNQNLLASSNEILVDVDGDGQVEKRKIEVQDKVYHDFSEPGDY